MPAPIQYARISLKWWAVGKETDRKERHLPTEGFKRRLVWESVGRPMLAKTAQILWSLPKPISGIFF